jgi:curli biogenesis system outer membrane secretion channel CsgG
MKRTHKVVVLLVVPLVVGAGIAVLLYTVSPAAAQTSASYNLEWHVISGGAVPISSASFAVNSTAGQGAASPPYSSSASYRVSAGYWYASNYRIFLPLLVRDFP